MEPAHGRPGEPGAVNGYKAFWRGKTCEVLACYPYQAQKLAAAKLGAKKTHEVAVVLCEKQGETVTHSTTELG